MAAAAALPLLLLAAFVVERLVHAERAAAIRGVLEAARAVSLAVDAELAAAEIALRALATSGHLGIGDLSSFHRQAALARTSEASAIVLYDPLGRVLLSTAHELRGAEAEPAARPERIARALAGGGSQMSDLERSSDGRQLGIAVDVPVVIDEQRYVLSQRFPAQHFQNLLAARQTPEHWIVRLLDRQLITIARSHRPAEFVGRPAADELRIATAAAAEGHARHPSREGTDVYDVFTRSGRSGWVVAIGVPADTLDAAGNDAIAIGLIGALACAMTIALIAFALGHRLRNALLRAAQAASGLAGGEPLPRYDTPISETEALRAALEQTHAVLEQDNESRARAEAERLQLFESEQAARQLAEQQNRAKDEFLAMLGHELRNPLSAVSGAVALMKAPGAQEEHRQHAREVISRQVQHLSRLVDDLLDLSRVMTGKITLDTQPLDLAQAASSCLSAMRAAGRAGEHAVSVDLHPVWVEGDPIRLEQIISNLLANAFKYTPPEGRIELKVAAEGDEAVLSVRDTGIGIPPKLLPHVFDVFVQGEQSLERGKGGLGIGLTLVQRLVHLHGGSVQAQSSGEGRGSVFTVRLPRIAAENRAGGDVAAGTIPRRLRVLVVDDHEDSRTMLRLLLEQSGHEAVEAVDGIDGVQLALSTRPDVAIVDIGLPGINGYEVARRLRALPLSGSVAMIALTGYGQEEDRRRALQAGFDRHLVKPVDAERLKQALMEVARTQPIASPPG